MSKKRRFTKWLLASLGLLGIITGSFLVRFHIRRQREFADNEKILQEAIEETDRLEPGGWRWENLQAARPVIPDKQNSAVLIKKLAADLGDSTTWAPKGIEVADVSVGLQTPNRDLDQADFADLQMIHQGKER